MKKAGSRRIDAFELWCWRRLWRVPWTARRSNQSILREISPEYSLEGLMLKVKLPIFCLLDAKNGLIGKDPDAGKDWMWEEKGMTDEMVGWHHQLNGHGFWVTSGSWWWTDRPGELHSMGLQSRTWLSNWTELNGLAVFPTLFNLSLNLAIRSSWSEPQSASGLVFADCIELLHFWLHFIMS